MTSATKCPQSERYVGQNDAEARGACGLKDRAAKLAENRRAGGNWARVPPGRLVNPEQCAEIGAANLVEPGAQSFLGHPGLAETGEIGCFEQGLRLR